MSSSNPSASNGASTTNGTNVINSTTATSSTSATLEDSIPSRARQASRAWRVFEDALREMSKHSQWFSQFEEAMDRHSAMELETQTKNMRIATLESSYDVQLEKFGKCYIKWEGEKSQLERKLVNIKDEITTEAQGMLEKRKTSHARELGEVRKELEVERKRVEKLTRERERIDAETKKVETILNHRTKQLENWEGYVSLLKDVDFKVL